MFRYFSSVKPLTNGGTEHDIHAMSDSGYCRKRETQQARTEMSVINMSNVTISNKVQKTDEKGVQTCDTITSNGKDTDTVRR